MLGFILVMPLMSKFLSLQPTTGLHSLFKLVITKPVVVVVIFMVGFKDRLNSIVGTTLREALFNFIITAFVVENFVEGKLKEHIDKLATAKAGVLTEASSN